MSDEIKPEEEATQQSVGQKRQNSENGGPASKKANIEAGDGIGQFFRWSGGGEDSWFNF